MKKLSRITSTVIAFLCTASFLPISDAYADKIEDTTDEYQVMASENAPRIFLSSIQGYPGETVTVYLTTDSSFASCSLLMEWDSNLIYNYDSLKFLNLMNGTCTENDNGITIDIYNSDTTESGNVISANFTIPDSATAGDEYYINISLNSFYTSDGDVTADTEAFGGTVMVADAPEDSEGNWWYNILEYSVHNGEVVITGCADTLSEIEIPVEIDGMSVTTIGAGAFKNNGKLSKVTVNESVKNIENAAFSNCTNLESLIIKRFNCEIYDADDTINSTVTIYGYVDSNAQAYAEKYGLKFKIYGTEIVTGDVNEDGKLDIRDAAFIARMLAGKKGSDLPECADFNEDGDKNIRDAAAIARTLANKPAQ